MRAYTPKRARAFTSRYPNRGVVCPRAGPPKFISSTVSSKKNGKAASHKDQPDGDGEKRRRCPVTSSVRPHHETLADTSENVKSSNSYGDVRRPGASSGGGPRRRPTASNLSPHVSARRLKAGDRVPQKAERTGRLRTRRSLSIVQKERVFLIDI